MKYAIKHENGRVSYAMRTGKVFVKDTMPIAFANSIMKLGKKVKVSDKRGYGKEISVDDTYFFPYDKTIEEDVVEGTEVAENE